MTDAIPPQDNTANKATGVNKESAVISNAPPSPQGYQITCKTQRDWRDKVKFWAEAVGLLFLIVYTVFTVKIAFANKKAADAAKSAAETAHDALQKSIESFRIDERAWIEIEPIKPRLLSKDAKLGDAFTCNIYPKNVGKTVARNIVVKAQAFGSGEGFGSDVFAMRSAQDKMLLDKFTESGSGNPILVPRNPVPKVLAPGTTATAPFTLSCQESHTFPSGHQLIHYIVGRLDYCDQFQIPHWMKFCFFVANARGEVWNCQEGNDEDSNPEVTADQKAACHAP